MPFCVNCGSEVSRDTTVCPNCKNSPWHLTDVTLEEVDERLLVGKKN